MMDPLSNTRYNVKDFDIDQYQQEASNDIPLGDESGNVGHMTLSTYMDTRPGAREPWREP